MSSPLPFPGVFRGADQDDRDEATGMFPVARLSLCATTGPLRGKRFAFDGGPFVLGRAVSCTVSIPSDGVSRTHARIEYGNGGYWLIPENTVNGTRVNDALIQAPTQLAENDRITLHDSIFLVAYGEREAEVELAAIMPAASRSIAGPHLSNGPFPATAELPRLETRPFRPIASPSTAPPPATSPPISAGPPVRVRFPMWVVGGILLVVFVAGIVVATVRLVQPSAGTPVAVTPTSGTNGPARAPAQRTAAPVGSTGQTPLPGPTTGPAANLAAGTATAGPAGSPLPQPPPAKLVGVLNLDVARVVAETSGSMVDVVTVGSVVERGAAIAHYRVASAESEQKRERLRELERNFQDSPEHADFIDQARRDYAQARNRREVRPINAPIRGLVVRVAVNPRASVRKNDLIAELSLARLVVPAAAVEGHGDRCTIELIDRRETLSGVLLDAANVTADRTFELERVPEGLHSGALGAVGVRCAASAPTEGK